MGKFHESLDSLGTAEGGGVMYPDTFRDDITLAYDTDMQGASAVIADLEAQLAQARADLQTAYADNWKLSQTISANTPIDNDPGDGGDEGDGDSDADDEYGEDDADSDDFFVEKDK